MIEATFLNEPEEAIGSSPEGIGRLFTYPDGELIELAYNRADGGPDCLPMAARSGAEGAMVLLLSHF